MTFGQTTQINQAWARRGTAETTALGFNLDFCVIKSISRDSDRTHEACVGGDEILSGLDDGGVDGAGGLDGARVGHTAGDTVRG